MPDKSLISNQIATLAKSAPLTVSLLRLIVGICLMFIVAGKLLDPLAFTKVQLSSLYFAGIVADISLGILLVCTPISVWSSAASFFGFSCMLTYRLFNWGKQCDCLGVFSSFTSDYVGLIIVITGLFVSIIPLVLKQANACSS